MKMNHIVIAIVLVVALVCGGGYFYVQNENTKAAILVGQKQEAVETIATEKAAEEDVAAAKVEADKAAVDNPKGNMYLGLTVTTLTDITGMVGSPTPVGAGDGHAGLIDPNGSLWMWGNNYNGQLGNDGGGNAQNGIGYYQTVPIKVLDNITSVNCGGKTTAVIKTDGSLWMWGENYNGALGNSAKEYVLNPLQVMDNVVAVSCGGSSVSGDYTAAIKTDGSLWMWGYNQKGQLGNGSTETSTVPIKVLDNVAAVSCGRLGHTAAIKTDGSLWMWGSNSDGQLGNGGEVNLERDQWEGVAARLSLSRCWITCQLSAVAFPIPPPSKLTAPCGYGEIITTDNWVTAPKRVLQSR